MTVYVPQGVLASGAIPVAVVSGGGGGGTNVTPAAGTTSTITTGGTAVTLATGPTSGGFITNPPIAASQGISVAENAYISLVGTPGSTDTNANGTTSVLVPGQTFTLPGVATGVTIKANAATSGHKLTVVIW